MAAGGVIQEHPLITITFPSFKNVLLYSPPRFVFIWHRKMSSSPRKSALCRNAGEKRKHGQLLMGGSRTDAVHALFYGLLLTMKGACRCALGFSCTEKYFPYTFIFFEIVFYFFAPASFYKYETDCRIKEFHETIFHCFP
jgi:hypothetical protein